MSGFLEKMWSLGVEMETAYSSASRQGKKAKAFVERLLSPDKEVTAEEYLEMYDMRIYDMSSKQNDIKFMKNIDFEGVYVLYNKSKKKALVGQGVKIFHKIDRQLRGYGNKMLYDDWENGDKIIVKIVRLDGSFYDEINALEKAIGEKYGAYTLGYNAPINPKRETNDYFCSNCGRKLSEGNRFCGHCGRPAPTNT